MIGKKLKLLREKRALKQLDLSTMLGVSRSTYTQYETGKSEPDLNTVLRLADFFNCSIDYLLGKTDNPIPYHVVSDESDLTPKERLKELFNHPKLQNKELAFKNFDTMDDEDIESIIEYIEARYLLAEKRKNDNNN